MRYFFLAYALIALLVVGIFGFRGQKFSKPPIRCNGSAAFATPAPSFSSKLDTSTSTPAQP